MGNRTAEVTPENYKAGAAVSSLSRLEYLYDYAGRVKAVTEVTVENGTETENRIAFYNYDTNGNLTYELDGNQNKTTYRYTPAGKLKELLTPEAAEAGQTYALRYTYDALGRVLTEENVLGGSTTYTYDGADNVKTVTKRAAGTSGTATVTYTYDGKGNVLTETTSAGLVTTYTYNTLGQMTSKTVTGAEGMADYTEIYRYDLAGRVVSVTNSMGTVTKTEYDGLGNVTERSVSDTAGGSIRTESYTYDENGNVRTYTNPENVTITYTYDALNRVTAETVTVSGKTQTAGTEYDGNGNVTAEVDTFGNRTSYTYDAFDRLTTVVSAVGIVLVSYIYDPAGNCISQTDALNKVTEYAYNGGGQVTETKDAEGNVTVQTYDALGNVAAVTDGENNTTTYTYDGFGRLLTVTAADGTKTTYTYDGWGNLRSQTDGKNNKTEYTYNAANLPLTKTESGTTVATYTYNGDGSVATMTDARGTVNTYIYNVHGDLLNETAEGTDGNKSTYTYTYDKAGNLLSMTDGSGTTTYKYDALGRVTEKDAPDFGKVTYTYDLLSSMEDGYHYELQNDPTGSTRTVYDRQNRVVKVTTQSMEGEDEVVSISYYDNGARKQVTYGHGSTEKYTFYDNGLVKSVTNTLADSTVIDSFTYVYDGAGNQISKTELTNGVDRGTTIYTYDAQNRLESVTEPDGTVITYTYDGAGNRATETTVENGVETVKTYSYNGRNQLLNVVQAVEGVTVMKTVYTYDANGNQLSQTETTYAVATESGTDETVTVLTNTYDLRNQLMKSVTEDATINNTYNAAGYRVSKAVTENGINSKTYFLYDGGNVIMEEDEDGVIAKNTYGGPLLLRTVFESDGAETTYQYMYNAHGDVVTLLTDGTVVATYYYDSFGNILDQTGEVDNSILYAGYQYDAETGLYYINARMYDPVTARFLQADTYLGSLNDPLSLNLYTYCLNNPQKYVDPTGHSVLLAFLLVTAVSFAVGAGMEYINQKYIEQRDVINYDLIFFEGAFNAVIAAVSFGTANLGATAARQGLRLTARTTTWAVGRSMAFGAAEGAAEDIGRQLVEGKTFSEIDYGQVAFSATINGITGGIGGYSGAKKEAFDYARQANKSNVGSMAQMGVGVDDVVEAGVSNRHVKLNLQFFAGDDVYQRGKVTEVNTEFKQTFYQVTSKEDAKKIMKDKVLIGKEFKEVYAWTVQPTLKQVSDSGARSMETVISFEVHPNVFTRDPHIDESLKDIARISVRPAPITVSNVKEVGFKKEWWKFWKK